MNKSLFVLVMLMLATIVSVMGAYSGAITISSPDNTTTITDRTPTITFKVVTNNASELVCAASFDSQTKTGLTATNNTYYTTTAFTTISDGARLFNVTCAGGGVGLGNTTIDAFGYTTTDVAPSVIDLLVTIGVGILGFASIIGLMLLYRWMKK